MTIVAVVIVVVLFCVPHKLDSGDTDTDIQTHKNCVLLLQSKRQCEEQESVLTALSPAKIA